MSQVETAQTCIQKAALGPIVNMFNVSGKSPLLSFAKRADIIIIVKESVERGKS